MNSNRGKKGKAKPAQTQQVETKELDPPDEPMQEEPPQLPAQMTLEHAMTHYKKTVEDVHRKRVNKMNAFNYRMTQYLMNVFTAFNDQREQEGVKWETYGEGIDVCAEVYGYCVDFVHMSTNRLMNGLHRINGEPEVVESDHSSDEKDPDDRPKKQKRKALQDGLTTLDPPEALQSKTIEKGYELDPFYAKMSSCFDAGKSEGILLNNLKVNEGLELLLYSKEPMECPFDQPFGVFQQACFPDLTVEHLEEETLCKELDAFEAQFITGTMPRASTFQQIIEDIGADMDDPSDLPDQVEEAAVFRETFENTIPGTEIATETDGKVAQRPISLDESLNHLSKLSDFHFFTAKPSTWAGFEYWNKSVVSLGAKKGEKKARRKEPAALEFNPADVQDRKTLFLNETKDNTFRQKYFEDLVLEDYTLPMDYQVSLRRFTQTFSKPNTQVKIFRHDTDSRAAPIEENVIVQNYESQPGMDSPAGGEDENDLYAREEEVREPPPLPTQTREDQLQFSKVSKRVDIRLLKDEMWRNLGVLNRENILGAENRRPHSRESSLSKSDTSSDPPTFMQVVRGLPDKLPAHELENLSIHSCFITMLHLANEKSKIYADLTLESVGECDFRIAIRNP